MGRPRKWPAELSASEVNHLRYVQRQQKKALVRQAENAIRSEDPELEIKAAMTAALLERGPKTLRKLCNRLINLGLAKRPDKAAIREIFDRLEGKAAQKVELKATRENASLDAIRSMPRDVAIQQLRDAQSQINSMLRELTSSSDQTPALPDSVDVETFDAEPEVPDLLQ